MSKVDAELGHHEGVIKSNEDYRTLLYSMCRHCKSPNDGAKACDPNNFDIHLRTKQDTLDTKDKSEGHSLDSSIHMSPIC